MNLKTIIFIGRSGCGKGTQVELLIDYLKKNDTRPVFSLDAGAKLRSFIKEKFYSSELAYENAEQGKLQPEFISIWAWVSALLENLQRDEHLIIDGTPRRLGEAGVLESVFEFFQRENIEIVYINVSRKWAIERMQSRGRMDDQNMKSINTRMDWFESSVVPVIDLYRAHPHHNFHEVNGEQSVEMVHKNIMSVLGLAK